MLKLIGALFFFTISMSCNKNSDNVPGEPGSLAGRWVATERYSSPGAGGSWNPLPGDQQFTLEFKSDSSFIYSANFPKADSLFSQYRLSANRIHVSSLLNSKTDTWYYEIESNGRLSLGVYTCFEGCNYGLYRVR